MSWVTVAKKEYLENVRNAWVITVTAIFLALTLLTSYVTGIATTFDGSGSAREAFADIVTTLNAMQTVGGFLLPILALVLGFATIAGERESGSLGLLAAQPLSRGDIVIGKWVGLWGVLATATLAGFGLGGLVILANTGAGTLGFTVLMVFLLETLAWGAAWISITIFLSAWFNRRGTAIAGSIGTWFLFGRFVWNVLTLLFLVAVLGPQFENMIEQDRVDVPGWLILTQLLSPNAVYDGLLSTTIEGYTTITGTIGKMALPDLYTAYTFGLGMAAWIALPFLGAHALFHRRDI